jgi:hypothetical protein
LNDAIDLANVRVEGSNPEVLTWPITSELQEFWIRPGTMRVRYDKQGQWPPVDMGGALQEATVWVFVRINGEWIGTGAERLRRNQMDKPQSDRPIETIGTSWLYARDRWPTLASYVPHDGELVGFMVAAGSTRSDFNVTVRERTNVVLARYSDWDGGHFEMVANQAPSPPAPQPSPPQPIPQPQPTDLKPVLDRLEKRVDEVRVLLEMLLTDPDPSYYGTATLPRILGGGTTTVRLDPVQPKRS